ncbi:MAG: asparagine synthetase B [Candidatus Latescibacteria bacterium]|nr:asparagine synthetase B [Candidatus Latescibacterota bacterium]
MRKLLYTTLFTLLFQSVIFAKLLIPMDLTQTNHLMAYGVAYTVLEQGVTAEWLLNYRGGSFLLPEDPSIIRLCQIRGVRTEIIDPGQEISIRKIIEQENMDAILLEKAPKIAVYVPPNALPWDDAVQLALDYAKIPYDKLWDKEVLEGKLYKYDWLHLHHEDFTGQFGKFGAHYHGTEWYQQDVILNQLMAKSLGFNKVSKLKLAVIQQVKKYIESGGMVFAMCSATDTPDIALAAENTDIVPAEFDGDPVDPDFMSKLDYTKCLAFQNFTPIINPNIYEHSDIDTYLETIARGSNVYFSLFDFSAKYDPVPTMLVQNHVSLVKEFLGQNCGFRRDKIKDNILILGDIANTEQVKYIHGKHGKGTFTFLGGHDPEDFAHRIGDPPTNLELHKNSPGYRLILNNVLFPAAEKKPLKT